MNNDVVAVLFIMLFGVACFGSGAGWMRNRGRGEWEEGYERGFAKATRNLFKTAVRATTEQRTENANAGRFLLRRPWARAAVVEPVDDGPTVPIPPPALDEDTTVVVAFRRPNQEQAA